MARKIKIYLDTSVISAKFDDRNPDRKELTENFFVIIDQYDPYISRITIAEIENTPDAALKTKMQECVKGFNVLEISEAIENLAQEYVKGGAIPKNMSKVGLFPRNIKRMRTTSRSRLSTKSTTCLAGTSSTWSSKRPAPS